MRKIFIILACTVLFSNLFGVSPALSESFIGEIRMFAGNFAPRDWAFCNGQLLAIADSAALYSILGTTYGGDGRVTFALPDLRGRVPMHPGWGPGLTRKILGETAGMESVTLAASQMPPHTHQAKASSEAPDTNSPAGAVPATKVRTNLYGFEPANEDLVDMDSKNISSTGGGQPHENLPPYGCINFIICLNGLYPPRN